MKDYEIKESDYRRESNYKGPGESLNGSALTEDQVRYKIFGGCIRKGIPLREHPKVAFHALSVWVFGWI